MARNKKETILRLIVYFGMFLIYLFLFMSTEEGMELDRGIEGVDYEYVVLSDESSGNNTYIKYLNLGTLETKKASINVNVYMQDRDGIYRQGSPMYSGRLAANEIVISEKAAKKLKLDIGSSVKLDFILSEGKMPYIVKGIFEYITDYYDFKGNCDFSAILIGYDEKIFQKNRNEYVSFLNEGELTSYMESTISYKDILYVQNEKAMIKNESIFIKILLISLHVLLFGVYSIVTRNVVMCEMKKYHYDSFPMISIYYFIKSYRRRIILLPWIISMLSIMIIGNGLFPLKYWVTGFLAEMLVYAFLWIRNSIYGKSVRV